MNKLFKDEKIFLLIFLLSLLSLFRTFIVPLQGDEITYNSIAENMLKGKYFLDEHPSTVAPVMPFLISVFKSASFPAMGLALSKICNIGLLLFGFRFLFLFLTRQGLNDRIVLSIIALTAVNPIGIRFFGSLYPESILFFGFWGLMYYANKKNTLKNVLKMLGLFLLLSITRYVYLVLGLVMLIHVFKYFKDNRRVDSMKLIGYSAVLIVPFLFWAKYVYGIESSNLSEISYFDRFKTESPIVYNIKAGLGLIKHHEVSRINGVPAFISLFVPQTGLRNYMVSIMLILAFVIGYFRNKNTDGVKTLILAMALIMFGLVLAGTGFSRYWLVLLPGFFLGYYFLARQIKLSDKWFVYGAQFVCFVYILNELRLDLLIWNRHI